MAKNVLLITADQFRGDCLSALGLDFVKTPHLDALASDGAMTSLLDGLQPVILGPAAPRATLYLLNVGERRRPSPPLPPSHAPRTHMRGKHTPQSHSHSPLARQLLT